MGRLRDARGTDALAAAAELIPILGELAEDRALTDGLKNGMAAGEAVSRLLRDHAPAVLRLLALDDGISPEEEGELLSPFDIPGRLLGLLRDPGCAALFGSAAAEKGGNGSSAA